MTCLGVSLVYSLADGGCLPVLGSQQPPASLDSEEVGLGVQTGDLWEQRGEAFQPRWVSCEAAGLGGSMVARRSPDCSQSEKRVSEWGRWEDGISWQEPRTWLRTTHLEEAQLPLCCAEGSHAFL